MVAMDAVEPRRKPKSRDGCQRCKIKRLKCDETKPECRNCVGRGIVCPGYKKLIKWSTKYEAYMPGSSRGLILGPNQVQEDRLVREDAGAASPVTDEEPRQGAGRVQKKRGSGGRRGEKGEVRRRRRESSGATGSERGVAVEEEERRAAVDAHTARVAECVEPLQEPDTEARGAEDATPVPNLDVPQTGAPIEDHPPLDPPSEPPFEPPAWEDPSMDPPALEDFPLDIFDMDIPDIDWSTLDMPGEENHAHNALHEPTEADHPAPDDVPRLNTPLSRALIRSYARVYPPAPIPPTLIEPGMALVEHYFANVCMLYSSFDSSLNPFRSAVARIWDSSPAIYYAIQSMAAAQLANTHPAASALGLELRRQAYATLNEELALVAQGKTSSERALLAILLLGLSACWHDCTDLGLGHLVAARRLIYPRLLAPVPPENVAMVRQNQFFEESLIYWEMLIGFVSQEGGMGPPLGRWSACHSSGFGSGGGGAATTVNKLLPHPWTGIAPQVQGLFAEVGRLIRCERLSHHHKHNNTGGSGHYNATTQRQAQERILLAAQLEEALLSCALPTTDDLIDCGDRNTTKADFVAVGEAYRCTGLLELYRVFPPLLGRRLGQGGEGRWWERGTGFGASVGVAATMAGNGMSDELGTGNSPSASSSSSSTASTPAPPSTKPPIPPPHIDHPPSPLPPPSTPPTHFLTSLALHILALLSALPSSSGTCSTQPILLVAAASELRLLHSLDYMDFSTSASRVRSARAFVELRLEEFMRRLPREPLVCMRRLVREVWRGLDECGGGSGVGEEVFWLDVAWERGWLTVMG